MKTNGAFLEIVGKRDERAIIEDIARLAKGTVWVLYYLDGVPEEEKFLRGERRSTFLESVNTTLYGKEVSDDEVRVLLSAFHVDWLKLVAIKIGAAHPKFEEVEISRGAVPPTVDFVVEVFDSSPIVLYIREEAALAEIKRQYPAYAQPIIDPDSHPAWG